MTSAKTPPSGEDRLIGRFFRPLAKHAGALDLLDDAACFVPPLGQDLVLTVDASVGGTHFFADDPAGLVAKKALRVNLSDLAAKGAKPLGILLSLSMPEDTGEAWLADFANGLGEDLDVFGCPLLGGDTTKTQGPVTISITAIGAVPSGKMVRRAGARAGDLLVVTGTIGDAVLGLALRRNPEHPAFAELGPEAREFLTGRYLLPQPRVALAEAIRDCASAAIDLSDGLAGDIGKLAAVSGVAARIDIAAVPLSEAVRRVLSAAPEFLENVLGGGDDYEIAAAVPPGRLERLADSGARVGVAVTTIGRIETGGGATLVGPDGQTVRLKRPSFSHF